MARAWLSAAPTIQVLVAELVPTPSSSLIWPASGLGMRFQLLPSNCSARVWAAPLLSNSPTAQMFRSEVAATPSSRLEVPIAGMAVWVQVRPFQCSIRAWELPSVVEPTAQALLEVRAATPVSWLAAVLEPGFAPGITVQLVPFQRSIRVCLTKLPLVVVPTAQASAGEVAVIPAREPSRLPDGRLPPVTTVQAWPS